VRRSFDGEARHRSIDHRGGKTMIELHRVYEHQRTKGTRFLVERLWPRGIRKESLHFSRWLKDVAPSDSLRRWFQHDVAKWAEFQRRYRAELDERPEAWAPIVEAARAGDVVLLYSSHDTEHNNAVVLRDYVSERVAQR
jgi:uncharacterized protein YeaO (DUF488 family)